MMCRNVDKDATAPVMPDTSPEPSERTASGPAPAQPRVSKPAFIGQAMGTLLQSADVKVRRDDQTRVLSRANDALAEVERRRPGSIDPPAPAPMPGPTSGPPRPRVDTVLWIVLTAGLFAIVGFMLAYGR